MDNDNRSTELNNTDKKLHISDVIERYKKIKNEYSECMSNYIKTGSRIYLDRAKEIEIIFDFFNG
jgi:hypothetical protein